MPLTPSPRLLLKRNTGSDPFLRTDFISNWDKLDLAPGITICTRGTRPTWSSAQSGMQIFETDSRTQYSWDGTSWHEVLMVASGWQGVLVVNAGISAGASPVYTLGTIHSARPGHLVVIMTAQYSLYPTVSQQLRSYVLIDGVDSTQYGPNGMQWTASTGLSGAPDNRSHDIHASAVITPGTHTIAAKSAIGTISSSGIYLTGFAYTAWLSNLGDTG